MKNTVLLITLMILGMLTLVILNTIYGRMDRRMELESHLSSVVEEMVEEMVLASAYDTTDMDDLIGELAEQLCISMDTVNDVTIDVFQCDMEKGILSLRVTLSYMHPNEDRGTIVCEKHVILNQLVETEVNE